jgi:hypothetical protein
MIRRNYSKGGYDEVTNVKKIEQWKGNTYILTWQQFDKKGNPYGDPYNAYISEEDYNVLKIRSIIENKFGVPPELMEELHDAEYERQLKSFEENYYDN